MTAPEAVNLARTTIGARIGRCGPAVVVTAAVVSVVLRWWTLPLDAVALGAVTATLGILSVIDLREHRLPNAVVGPLTLAVVAFLAGHALAEAAPSALVPPLLTGLGASGLFYLGWWAGGLGLGDVKLVFPLVALLRWAGGGALTTAVAVTALVGGVAAVVIMAGGRSRPRRMAYGPVLAAGAVAGLLVGPG